MNVPFFKRVPQDFYHLKLTVGIKQRSISDILVSARQLHTEFRVICKINLTLPVDIFFTSNMLMIPGVTDVVHFSLSLSGNCVAEFLYYARDVIVGMDTMPSFKGVDRLNYRGRA